MAIPITRAEYEARFGIKPVLQPIQNSTIDTTPAPIRITRAEYEQMFFPKQKSGLRKTLDTVQGEVASAQMEGVSKIKRGFEQAENATTLKDEIRGRLRLTSGVIDTAFAPLAPVFGRAMGLLEKRIDRATDDPNLQRFAMSTAGEKTTTTLEDIVDISNIAGLYTGGKSAPKIASNVGKFTQDTTSSISTGLKNRATNKLANEILNIENSYNKTAIKNTLSKDTGNASRQRIANTDVLSNIVDEDGKITFESAKNAAKAYEQQTIAGAEGVVRDILKNENKTINLEEVRNILRQEIATSGLEGADLITALNGLKKEIAGLAMRGDEFGNVPLYKIHDSKISTTRNIDYTKPPEVSYRRSLARAYKNIIEQKSQAKVRVFGKDYRIPEINAKLSEYYGDIERIEALGGKRVKGGRLGRYSAQIAGNLTGAGAGAMVGGPVGMAIGTVVGGEVASRLKGKQMANTFGKPRGRVAPKSDLLEAAKLKAQEGQVIDLRIPDKKVGASTKVPKTKEISRVEAQIAKNVADQKKAIKAGDFTLVKALKEVYRALVEKLKDLIKLAKETSEKGFINFGEITDSVSGRSSKPGKSPKTETKLQAPSKNSTTKAKEAQVYKGEKDLTTKILKDLEGKTTVSKQYILDATNRGELKQVERDLIRDIVSKEGDTVNVADFAKKVKAELLPLKVKSSDLYSPNPKYGEGMLEEGNFTPKWEGVTLKEGRGNVANYKENIYESPIKTSAGKQHYDYQTDNYFGHTRIEDMADNKTRRVIEVQSDLYQKGNLEKETTKGLLPYTDTKQIPVEQMRNNGWTEEQIRHALAEPANREAKIAENQKRIAKLQQYNDPTAHFRMIREEIKKASQDGKTKLQFPTGETAMKIEGLGERAKPFIFIPDKTKPHITKALNMEDLKVGQQIQENADNSFSSWIITDVLGDGKFKAVPKETFDKVIKYTPENSSITEKINFLNNPDNNRLISNSVEQFDISGKVDTNNPIYKFYEKDVQKYLNKFGGTKVVDENGVSWIEVPVKKEWAKMPVEAFAIIGAVGLASQE